MFRKLCLGVGLLAASLGAQAAGLLRPADGSLPALQLKEHHVRVVIEDGYAVTRIEQVFHNPNARDLEAVYSFPVPEHGSVGEFVVWIDGKPVVGEVLPKEKAREVYRQEQAAGQEAGIAEQDGFKTFDIAVSPVRAGADTRVRLAYYQGAKVDMGIGRYVYPLEEGGVDEEKLAFWTADSKVTSAFSFNMRLRSAYPVDAVRLPDFPNAQVNRTGPGEWEVSIVRGVGSAGAFADDDAQVATPGASGGAGSAAQAAQASPGRPLAEDAYARQLAAEGGAAAAPAPDAVFDLSKDIVVYWRHQQGLPGSVDLITYKPDPKGKGTFMLVVTPGDDLKPIQEGQDWVFILDVSGSMSGKFASLADGVSQALGRMRPQDRYRIVLFNNDARELTSGYLPATRDNVERSLRELAKVQVNGGTNLYSGVALGLDTLEADRTSALVLVTDGVANIGHTAEKQFLQLLGTKDVRLFTFIMGNSANLPLLESLAKASNGFAMTVSNSDDIVGKVLLAADKVTHEALHGAQLKIDGVRVSDLTPVNIGSLYRGQQLVVLGHYFGAGEAEVSLSGKRSGQPISYRTRFAFPAQSDLNPELERLWAYGKISDLEREQALFGEDADRKQAMVDTALQYGLVTDHTSMVVLREEQFAQHGIDRRNRDRVQREAQAQAQRAAAPVRSHRVDEQRPMYTSSRPSVRGGGGGGGSVGWLALGLLGAAAWVGRRGR